MIRALWFYVNEHFFYLKIFFVLVVSKMNDFEQTTKCEKHQQKKLMQKTNTTKTNTYK